jgi:predicted nucleotidyltransferase
MIRDVEQQRRALADLCRRYRVRRLRLFGSAATGAFAPETSDLDFVAEFADTKPPITPTAISISPKRWSVCSIAVWTC